MRLVKHLNDFQHIQRQGIGFFIILDNANPVKVHSVGCSWVKEENFIRKVLTNKEKHGSYYWVQYWSEHYPSFKETPCRKCMS
ncbi:hypothetical protein [Alkalihalobacillus sp. AL-G]|uniref:hypothetical protein n=1 Tax=Alkalihalobacillus sp. AL-G TaxID=2926399 RepID=UPI002729C409|nr:hypothetical protein [Alkalihalobacillus sp. AL-G]WLD93908.1 hypothetical protein MOJ78_03030 [Alkalihalobacillus sp. AL-G]